ncbi:LysR substrate-binding domain-containing protein [Streptomyces sp. NPDC048717]|uniref:LysR substrate-binding domain-containing protein n=1 Tax=Streptomyces sp. NPDC048717 TaxID=3154928 RepID=UPI00342913D6
MPPSPAPAPPTASASVAAPLRFGVHGSYQLAAELLAAARLDPAGTVFIPYDVREPFIGLRAGEIDVMLVKYVPSEPDDLEFSAPVAEDGRAVIVRSGHPLAGRESVSVEEVAAYDGFACPGAFPASVWDEVVPRTTPAGRPIRRVHPMTTPEEMARILRGGNAVHLSFQSLAAAGLPGVEVVPVHDLAPAPVRLAWLRRAEQAPALREFLDRVEREVAA